MLNALWLFIRRSGALWLMLGAGGAIVLAGLFSSLRVYIPGQLLVVQSGSMEPAVGVGDVVLIKKKSDYQKGEVIAFQDSKNRRVTHRILAVNQDSSGSVFTTKGDANQTTDTEGVPISRVEGTVDIVIPYLGYVLVFGKTRRGMILMVLIPAVLLITDEVIKIKTLAGRTSHRRRHVI